jgi:hypothetical protein
VHGKLSPGAETIPHAKLGKETTINIPWVTAPTGFEPATLPTLGKFEGCKEGREVWKKTIQTHLTCIIRDRHLVIYS